MTDLMNILIPFAVVGGVGLVLGVMLALVSRFFGVEENETEKELRALLPGINCGACGYRGCDDYAKALAEGTAKPNLCVPGAESVAKELGAKLGVEVEKAADMVAYVHCNGNCDATGKKADYIGLATCRAASMLYAGDGACAYGCLGFGDCAAACPVGAICMKDGIAHVDTSRCIGCTLCTDVCPKKIISMLPQNARAAVMCSNEDKGAEARRACKNACIACRKCEKTCPRGAITVVDDLALIDYTKCTGCGECVAVCPTGCLKSVYFPDLGETAYE